MPYKFIKTPSGNFLKSSNGNFLQKLYIDNPTQLSDCKLWLDASSGVTYDGSNKVSKWNDLTGNGNSVISGATRPTYTANYLNGKPVVLFDRTNYLWNTTNNVMDIGTSSVTCFVVFKPTASEGAVISKQYMYASCIVVSNKLQEVWTGVTTTEYSISDSNWYYHTSDVNRTTKILTEYLNGVYVNSKSGLSDLSSTSSNPFLIGRWVRPTSLYGWFVGYVAEIIWYNRTLTTAEIKSVETYIKNKYNL